MSKKDKIEARCLKGFRDYLPRPMAMRYHMLDIIRREAALSGFQLIGTPALEYAETLLGQGGDETDKQVYRFKDHGDRDVALRFDLTVPFARFVAEHQNDLSFPFKKLQIGDVWRGEKPQKGRYREFCQCDFDIIGADTAAADAEILGVLQRTLVQISAGPFTQAVGNRLILSALLRRILKIEGGQAETAALVALDKLAKTSRDYVQGALASLGGEAAANAGDGGSAAGRLLDLLTAKDAHGDSELSAVAQALAGDEPALAEIARLRQVVDLARSSAVLGASRLVIDLTIARGLGYYTGIVFETTLDLLPGVGSISSGGRYNDLAGRFTSRELPGVGGSIGLDRLLAGVEELQELGKLVTPAAGGGRGPVFIAVATADALAYALQIASRLRRAGVAAELGLTGKLQAQFKHADRLGCPLVVTVGTSEMEQSSYALKSMHDGKEERGLPVADVEGAVKRRLPAP